MKRFLASLSVLVATLVPAAAHAAVISTGGEYALGATQTVADDLYVAAGTAIINGDVTGDVVAAGGTVTVTGDVAEDVLVAGGTVQLLGPVGGDVRVVGGSVTVGGAVGGDVVVAGGTVRIIPDARITGGVYAAGGTVSIDGLVAGDAQVAAGTLTVSGSVGGSLEARVGETIAVESGGAVGGDVVYSAPRQLTLAPDASIGGEVQYSRRFSGMRRGAENAASAAGWAVVAAMTAIQTFAMLGGAVLVVWLWRRPGTELVQEATTPFWKNAAWGLLFFIAVPLAAVFLAATVIGIAPAVLLMLFYGAAGLVAHVMAGVMLGALVERVIRRTAVLHVTWAGALFGVLLFQLVALIPLAGWLLRTLLFLSLFGVLSHRIRRMLA